MLRVVLLLVAVFQCFVAILHADTVVAIHGFLTNARTMKPVKVSLEKCGLNVFLWEYPSRQRYVEEHACELVTVLQQMACQCPGQPIHFVTHSIGALILRAAINTPSCPIEAKIGRAVLLAPPSQGSCLARKFRGVFPINFVMGDKSGWQLMNYNPYQISAFGDFPSSMKVLVVAGCRGNSIFFHQPNDGFLTLEETYLNSPFDFLCFKATHGDLIKDHKVLLCMKKYLLNPES